jgi:hypothetical protein
MESGSEDCTVMATLGKKQPCSDWAREEEEKGEIRRKKDEREEEQHRGEEWEGGMAWCDSSKPSAKRG